MRPHYYNEWDKNTATWLKELVKEGILPAGEVDTRDVREVSPSDLKGFEWCHFFAGIGCHAYAAHANGMTGNEGQRWSASLPCQPFSAAGRGLGVKDERHLWPGFFNDLVRECRPDLIVGEQVSSQDGLAWLDIVQTDLEGALYACGPLDSSAASVGAPQIRQRLYWTALRMADGDDRGQYPLLQPEEDCVPQDLRGGSPVRPRGHMAGWHEGSDVRLADDDDERLHRSGRRSEQDGWGQSPHGRRDVGLGNDDDEGLEGRREPGRERQGERAPRSSGLADGRLGGADDSLRRADGPGGDDIFGDDAGRPKGAGHNRVAGSWIRGDYQGTRPTDGFWRDADWLLGRDGKWRPVEPGTFPLADGSPARVVRLRGYGNGLCLEHAIAYYATVKEVLDLDLTLADLVSA